MKKIIKGALYYADMDLITDPNQKRCIPVVVIQNEFTHKNNTVIVAPIETKNNELLPTHIPISQFKQIRPNSIILLEQIRAINKSNLKGFIDFLADNQLKEINRCLTRLFDI